jgi:shikimate kinase
VDQQLKRTRRGRERPLLKQGDRRATLEALMEIREPLYRGIADLVVDTNGRRVASVAREIRDKLGL